MQSVPLTDYFGCGRQEKQMHNRIDCCIMEICLAKKTLYLKRARCLGRAESAGYMTVRAGFVRFTSMTNDAKHLKMKKCLCDQEISA